MEILLGILKKRRPPNSRIINIVIRVASWQLWPSLLSVVHRKMVQKLRLRPKIENSHRDIVKLMSLVLKVESQSEKWLIGKGVERISIKMTPYFEVIPVAKRLTVFHDFTSRLGITQSGIFNPNGNVSFWAARGSTVKRSSSADMNRPEHTFSHHVQKLSLVCFLFFLNFVCWSFLSFIIVSATFAFSFAMAVDKKLLQKVIIDIICLAVGKFR